MTTTTTMQDELMAQHVALDKQLDKLLEGPVWKLCDEMRMTAEVIRRYGGQAGRVALVRTRKQVLIDKTNQMKD